jgi:hypothetical protein
MGGTLERNIRVRLTALLKTLNKGFGKRSGMAGRKTHGVVFMYLYS